jgi:V-type H+-transporting ATPase subunit a
MPLLTDDGERDVAFSETLSGAISTTKQIMFERMLFRVSRGNAIVNFREVEAPVNDPQTGEPVQKTVFSIIAIKANQMQKRITKICAFFGANLYTVPRSIADFERELTVSHRKLVEHRAVLGKTSERISEVLVRLGVGPDGRSPLVDWTTALQQELGVCETLKRTFLLQGGGFGNQQTVVVLLGWVPTMHFADLRRTVDGVNKELSSQQVVVSEQEPKHSPPTYFRTNEFTGPFQQIVDTYGIARYREVNPGLFTVVTFPFLYGVMYGDMLHGSLLLIFSLYLIGNSANFKHQKKMGTAGMLGDIFEARYMVLMMSLFAVYNGVIYNDCASIPIDFFGSRWDMTGDVAVQKADVTWPYPFGIDPEWMGKKNELVLLNSLKMKMAVILGVIHMSFGICLGLLNHLHFKNYLAVVFEFIPRITFLLATFGYMCFLVIFKWCTDWSERQDIAPPNLIQTMIGMFLRPGSVDPSVQLYPHQATIQLGLLVAAGVCVPMMFFGEPCITNIMFKRKYGKKAQAQSDGADIPLVAEVAEVIEHDDEEEGGGHGHGELGPNYDFGDHLINQAIHTIEFVLGAVSNTASYLRLWALSLAHAQLAKVFWDKLMMQYGIDTGSVVLTVVGFAGWAACTAGVLLGMDVVECFLHALRLHWVEFQNKFYYADGYKFEPFDFELLGKDE